MFRFAPLLFLLFSSTAASAGSLDSFAGRYLGCAVSGGEWSPIETVLALSGGGLSGSYVFIESDGREVSGDILAGLPSGANGVALRWRDLYGEGPAVFTFSSDAARFDGYWMADQGTDRFAWYGVRADADQPAPDCRIPIS
ncbi:hypothetical protein [Oricola sp.]|uniref:hypothetical protein n=1 Tax=Oricola sp. TaxID=1979950 RepID=UPI0025FF763E|nr:hypothetical protein [Oricola sp.]MCI5077256.1 hypothetical protein [Oricola sp.]